MRVNRHQIAPVLVLAIILSASAGAAPQPPPQRSQATVDRIVSLCVERVRKETDKKARKRVSTFDAFAKSETAVVWYGTQKEYGRFKKCTTDLLGYPLVMKEAK